MDTTLNRRNFLKGALASGAVLMAGGALAGCASKAAIPATPLSALLQLNSPKKLTC
ncbi:MAG: twin-arginine translocation signal domain-containing protein [Eggerthellaceae bacterium]